MQWADMWADSHRFVKEQFESLKPSFISKHPHFNFITAHYFWIIGMSILASVLLYGSAHGNLAYIDALVFAAGANTQAGLNTIDVNRLNTFQQATMFVFAMASNPITINSFVVFLRLYWFEKRFQGIVKEAGQRRVTIAQSRSKAKPSSLDVEKGVGGRNITVMHNTGGAPRMTNDGILLDDFHMNGALKSDTEIGADGSTITDHDLPTSPRDTQIKFLDQVKRSDAEEAKQSFEGMYPRISEAEHLAILARQRNEDQGVLRIPGPRDADRGALPEEVDDGSDTDGTAPEPIYRRRRDSSVESPGNNDASISRPVSNQGRQQTITIAEGEHPKRDEINEDLSAAAKSLSALRFRRPRGDGEKLHTSDANKHSRYKTLKPLKPLSRIKTALSQNQEDPMPYLSWQPTIGRNSEFLGLTEEQREELGGIEYRSLKTLAVIVTAYFWGFWAFGIICLLPWILVNNPYYSQVVSSWSQGRTWWAFFTANSAFTDLGFTLTADSMNGFATATFPLLIMSFLIVIGNTGFPVMLRFVIWFTQLFVPRGSGLWEELRFLLDHPRRCFTLLFPSTPTWWLLLVLIILNGIDLIFYVILDLGNGPIGSTPLHVRFLDGWFQAASTRTAGFAVVDLADLHPAVQTSYLIMMYISVFPIAISVRRTNVYEERSLGLYGSANDDDDSNENQISYVGAHLRRQLSFDLWYIFIGFFILSLSEGKRLMSDDFSMFAVLFEVVSAYGTVGLSLGYPGLNASLCSQFSVVGKLVIAAMMIRGRHRGLPYGLDRAVLLPSETLNRKEAAAEAEAKIQRQMSTVSIPQGRRSTSRGRSRSVDRRNVLASFLQPGPRYPRHSLNVANLFPEDLGPFARHETLRRTTTEPPAVDMDEDDDEEPVPVRRHRRAETQPTNSFPDS
jgi:potassium uptake Trk family protein